MIRACVASDFDTILAIINEAAEAYRGVIPADCWHEPYMSADELRRETGAGIAFSGFEHEGALVGVMGVQPVRDVVLIRHAYVLSAHRRRGIGANLLEHLLARTEPPVLIGTWAAATWAIRFYEKYGFALVAADLKERLLRQYWTVPERQIATSVVLADARGQRHFYGHR